MVQRDRIRQLFLDLVNISSPSRRERGVADYVKAKLESLGFDVREDDAGAKIDGDAGNIIGFRKGSVPGAVPIFLCCHMDTADSTDKLQVVEEDGEIRTDGTTILGADDKAGIAAVIEGVQSVIESGAPHGDIEIFFDVSEEIGLLGAKAVDHSKIGAKMGYVLDTEKPVAGITISAPSHETLLVEIRGRAAHAGIAPEKGVSAIVAASRAIARMNLGRIDDETTANVGIIEGGKARNIVPDRVTIKAEARSRNEDKLVAQVEHMKQVFEEEAAAMGAEAIVNAQREYSTYRFSESDDVVKLAVRACKRIGIGPVFLEGGGGSDANVFNVAGIPAVVIGVGYEGAHAVSERISLDDLVKSAEYASALVLAAADTEA